MLKVQFVFTGLLLLTLLMLRLAANMFVWFGFKILDNLDVLTLTTQKVEILRSNIFLFLSFKQFNAWRFVNIIFFKCFSKRLY